MKRLFWVSWVLLITSTLLLAKDWNHPKAQEHRKVECEKLAMEMHREAMELEERASKMTDAEVSKLLGELAELKKKESENFTKLADAIRKKQWTVINRLEKKSGELCQEVSENWQKLEKKKAQLSKTKATSGGTLKPFSYSATKSHPPGSKPDSEKPAEAPSPKVSEPEQAASPAQSSATPEPALQ